MDDKISRRKELLKIATNLSYIDPDDIPNIELYMDQVTTFMENKLNHNKRNEEDKTMTKTMINNYTKNDLLPAPNKKKYSKDHIIMLLYIYYLKNFISINDIQTLLGPMLDSDCYDGESPLSIEEVYRKLFSYELDNYNDIIKSILSTYDKASKMYDPEKDEYLHDMCMVSLLSVDVYVKKKCIEHLIDDMRKQQEKNLQEKSEGKNGGKAGNNASSKAGSKAANSANGKAGSKVAGKATNNANDKAGSASAGSDVNKAGTKSTAASVKSKGASIEASNKVKKQK
jgi:hypothetical protein